MIPLLQCGRGCGCENLTREELDANPPACPVMAEFKKPHAERLAEYRTAFKSAQLQAGVDVPYKLQQLGVPHDAIRAIRRPGPNRSMEAARRFLEAPRNLIRTLVLVGVNGVGKSTAAAYVLADFVKSFRWNEGASGGGAKHSPFRWVHASEITSETDFGKVDPDFLEALKKAELLVIDDLGKDTTTPGLAALRDVMVVRHERCRPTVVTSNLPPVPHPKRPEEPNFKGLYGVSWYERLKTASIVPDLTGEKNLRVRLERDFEKRPTL